VSTSVSISGSGTVGVTVYGQGTVIAGNGNDSINISGGQGTIIVGSGHDTLTLNNGGTIQQFGSSGVDTINIGSGSYTITEQGSATVTGAFGSATISGGGTLSITDSAGTGQAASSGKVTVLGSTTRTEHINDKGWTFMHRGVSSDTMVGASAHQMLSGTHNLLGSLRGEQLGQQVLRNFVSGQSQAHVEGHTLAWTPAQQDISHFGGHSLITMGGTSIELHGLSGTIDKP
jgi:hypothetical protein